jgi:hypothetical protein
MLIDSLFLVTNHTVVSLVATAISDVLDDVCADLVDGSVHLGLQQVVKSLLVCDVVHMLLLRHRYSSEVIFDIGP